MTNIPRAGFRKAFRAARTLHKEGKLAEAEVAYRKLASAGEHREAVLQGLFDLYLYSGRPQQAAETLIAQGADVITQHTDSPAPVQAAEAKGVYAVGYHSDMSKHGKKAHLTAAVHNWGAYYTKIAKEVMAGTWKSGAYWGGIKDGIITLAPFGAAVPADVKKLVTERQAAIAAGKLHPFAGPVKDQDGKVRVSAGKTATDEELLGMKYFVKGVVGTLQ